MRIPRHIKWIALICLVAVLPLLLLVLPAFLYFADIIPWQGRPQSHPYFYTLIGAPVPPSGFVWSYGGFGLADSQSNYRLPLDSLPSARLQNAPLAESAQLANFARWWGGPQEGSRILIIEERARRYEVLWDAEAKAVFLSGSSY